MKKQILLLSGLLIGSQSMSAMDAKKVTRTKHEQYQANRQLINAATAYDTDRIKALLNEGLLRDTQEHETFPFDSIRAPFEIAMNVLELFEEYFMVKEGGQVPIQSTKDKDAVAKQAKLKTTLASFRNFLQQKRLNHQLVRAAKEGNALRTQELLKKGARMRGSFDSSGRTPFEWAAIEGHTEIMNLLLDHLEQEIQRDPVRDPQWHDTAYRELRQVNADRHLIVPLFKETREIWKSRSDALK